MKILHTSDWHLGRTLYGRKRYDEFSQFLNWLSETIEQRQIELLLVAGDVFDTSTPSNRAQQLYYQFLCKVSASSCRHIVIIAGNHDSPSFLDAPKELLKSLNVYVVGTITDSLQDEVLMINNEHGQAQLIVCAVPYLREKDIRKVEPGETLDDKAHKLIAGVQQHYAQVCALAEQKQAEILSQTQSSVPIIALGHLFTAGGKTLDGDGVRELYIGSLAYVGQEMFPDCIDYLALGHLHIPQQVADKDYFRYSGSPIAMSFAEAQQSKQLIQVEFVHNKSTIETIVVPCFQSLHRISGDLDALYRQVEKLKQDDSHAWLEIEYTGDEIVTQLWDLMAQMVEHSTIEILRIKNKQAVILTPVKEEETLDDLDENDVFERCLQAFDVAEDEQQELKASYNEILRSLDEEDSNAQ